MKKILLSAICLSIAFGCVSGAQACFKKKEAASTSKGIISVQQQSVQPYKNMSEAELTALVSKIGNNMLQKNNIQQNVTFKVDMDSVANAYTDIEHTITVYKGIIDFCSNEDELAFIIGHEMGHASQNHVLKAVGANYVGNLAVNAAVRGTINAVQNNSLATIAARGAEIGSTVANTAVQNKYSRNQEFTADSLGIDFMTKAGYDPRNAISIMSKFGENYADFWVDHPSTDRRLESMSEHIRENYPQYAQ